MQFHRSLDTILDHAGKLRVLRFLCRKGGEWNGRRLAAELGMNPVTAHKVLRQLREATLLDFRTMGNNFVYSLRDDHELVRRCLRPLFEQEVRSSERLRVLLQHGLGGPLTSAIVSVAIYGSLAQGHERPTSDIDLLVLVRSEAVKPAVHRALDRLAEQVMRAFGNPLAPYLNTVSEARQKSRRGPPLSRHPRVSPPVVGCSTSGTAR